MTILLATSLKMYFDHEETLGWAKEVARIAAGSPLVRNGEVELSLFPQFPSLSEARGIFAGSPVTLGAQHMAGHERGAYTGEVNAASLAQVGCTYVELAHAERLRLFDETIRDIQQKVRIAYDNGLTPLICTGEEFPATPAQAAAECIEFLTATVESTPLTARNDVVIAYEPVWAIGAPQPADACYVREVTRILRTWIDSNFKLGRIIYGGSAGPGLFSSLQGAVDGLFLGRFAHDPHAISALLEEIQSCLPSQH